MKQPLNVKEFDSWVGVGTFLELWMGMSGLNVKEEVCTLGFFWT